MLEIEERTQTKIPEDGECIRGEKLTVGNFTNLFKYIKSRHLYKTVSITT